MAIQNLADVNAHWRSQKIADEIRRSLRRGLEAGAVFLASRVKELVSVPAPRIRVTGKRGQAKGLVYYRATTPATKGAPPRKLSGRLRASITYEVKPDGSEVSARIGTNIVYSRRLEYEDHAYLNPALNRWRAQLAKIIERAAG